MPRERDYLVTYQTRDRRVPVFHEVVVEYATSPSHALRTAQMHEGPKMYGAKAVPITRKKGRSAPGEVIEMKSIMADPRFISDPAARRRASVQAHNARFQEMRFRSAATPKDAMKKQGLTSGPVIIKQLGKNGAFEVSREVGHERKSSTFPQYGTAVVIANKEARMAGVPVVDRVVGRAAGKAGKMRAYDVFLNGKKIDTVFYHASHAMSVADVKRGLIEHDGYDQGIHVRPGRASGVDAVVGRAAGKGLAHGYGKTACIVCLRAMTPRKDGKEYHAKCERLFNSNPGFYLRSASRPGTVPWRMTGNGHATGAVRKPGHCGVNTACEGCSKGKK